MKKWLIALLSFVPVVFMIPSTAGANEAQEESNSFRNLKVSDPFVEYVIHGKAKVFEGNYHYRIKDGDQVLIDGSSTASQGAPEWGNFQNTIHLSKSQSALKTDLTLELFEKSAKDGSEINKLILPLQKGNHAVANAAFKDIQISEPHVVYYVEGEARLHHGTYRYAVTEGHYYIVEGEGTASTTKPLWGTFAEKITIPLDQMPSNGTLIMELYEQNENDGQWIFSYPLVMDQTPW